MTDDKFQKLGTKEGSGHSRAFAVFYSALAAQPRSSSRTASVSPTPGTALSLPTANGRQWTRIKIHSFAFIRVHSRFFPAPLARLRSGSEAALLGPSREQCSATNREWIRRRFSSYGGQDFGELSRAATNGRELKFVHSRAFAVSILAPHFVS